MPKGRPLKYTKEEFQQHLQKAMHDNLNMQQFASRLGISIPNAYAYISRYHLKTVDYRLAKVRYEKSLSIYDAYRGRASAMNLAALFKLSAPTIRHHLGRAVDYLWSSDDKPEWPKPEHLYEIKIVHFFTENPTRRITTEPSEVAEHTGLSRDQVDPYLSRLYAPQKRRNKKVG